jgi:Raf kinase inhibitor-like YbhB/YbcL family protein
MLGLRQTFAAAAGVLLLAGTAHAAEPFTLSSPAFKDGGLLQLKNAGANKANPNCIGENVSPPLAWANPPEGTKSFAIVMTNTEGQAGVGNVHWVAYGIPASVTEIAEGEASKPSDKFVAGKGGAGLNIFIGPCPPPNLGYLHYVFQLIATDLDPKELPPSLTRDELFAKLKGHTKRGAAIVARYMRQ